MNIIFLFSNLDVLIQNCRSCLAHGLVNYDVVDGLHLLRQRHHLQQHLHTVEVGVPPTEINTFFFF